MGCREDMDRPAAGDGSCRRHRLRGCGLPAGQGSRGQEPRDRLRPREGLREGGEDGGMEFTAPAGVQARCELLGGQGGGRVGCQPSPLSLLLLPEIKSGIWVPEKMSPITWALGPASPTMSPLSVPVFPFPGLRLSLSRAPVSLSVSLPPCLSSLLPLYPRGPLVCVAHGRDPRLRPGAPLASGRKGQS